MHAFSCLLRVYRVRLRSLRGYLAKKSKRGTVTSSHMYSDQKVTRTSFEDFRSLLKPKDDRVRGEDACSYSGSRVIVDGSIVE